MEPVWQSAPVAAVKVWRVGNELATRRNEAAERWLAQQPWREAWPLALQSLASACEGRTERCQGRLEAGLLPVPIDWVCAPFDGGWMLWLSEPAERVAEPRGPAVDRSEVIAERRRADELLQRLQLVSEAGGVGFWRRGADDQPMEWNRQMFAIHGRDERRGAPSYDEWVRDYLHPDDVAEVARRVKLAAGRPEEGFRFEVRIRREDGALRWAESRSRGDSAGGRIGVFIDLTERRHAEAELHETREQSRLATEAAGIGVWVRDLIGGGSYWNAQMYRLRGLDPSDARPVMTLAALTQSPDERAALEHMLVRHVEEGLPYEGETTVHWPDGSERRLATRGRVARDAAGRPLRVSGVNWDVTQQHRAELALRDKHTAEEASRAKSDFLARVSHELRTPLNAVLGYAQLMAADAREPASPRQQERLTQVQRAARHLLDLIDDMLDLSRGDAAEARLPATRVPLVDAVQEALDEIGPLACEHGIQVSAEGVQGAVLADRRRMRQILGNLLSNAVKYNRPGGRVDIRLRRADRDGRPHFGLQVRDTGLGLSPAQQAHLFQPFDRLGAESRGIEGLGLGLTIVRQIVQRMSGYLEVESEAGRGSSFCVWLPAAGEEVARAVDTGFHVELPAEPGGRPVRSGLRVLCIEDNPVNLMLVRELFAMRPAMQLLTAQTGSEGIASALANPPDLVLLDMQLPDMDGAAVFRALRPMPQLAQTRFIALSANVMARDVDAALAAGFADYWTKPIDFARFLRGIDAIPVPAA